MACHPALLFLAFMATVLLGSAQPPDTPGMRDPPPGPGPVRSDVEDNELLQRFCPQGMGGGGRQSGSGSGEDESGSGSDDDDMSELDERFKRQDLDDFGSGSGGSGSGSGDDDLCGMPLYNAICYQVLNAINATLSNPLIASLPPGAVTPEEAKEAACIYSFAEDTCSVCEGFIEECGDPDVEIAATLCADEDFGAKCSRTGPTDCIFDSDDPVFCDTCAFYTSTCVSDEVQSCNTFGFKLLLGCTAVTQNNPFPCECFASGLLCTSCADVVDDCTGGEPTLPPGIAKQLEALSEEEVNNAVTMAFQGLTRFDVLINANLFRQLVADAVNTFTPSNPGSRKRLAEMTTQDDVIFVEPCPCEEDGNVRVVLYVSGDTDGTAIDGALVSQAVDSAGSMIATQIGADAYTGTSQGVPDDLTSEDDDDDDDGLSDGEIAAIVVVITVVAIVVVLAVILVVVFVLRGRGSFSPGKEKDGRGEHIPLEAPPQDEGEKKPM